jgi:hypothetical protein
MERVALCLLVIRDILPIAVFYQSVLVEVGIVAAEILQKFLTDFRGLGFEGYPFELRDPVQRADFWIFHICFL